MSANSSIEWTATVNPDGTVTKGHTWNPVRGCSVISPGCTNCYAMKQAHRFSGDGKAYAGLTKQTKAGPQWTGKVMLVEDHLLDPLRWRAPRRVFVNSMSDLFHESVPNEFIDRVFAVMALAPRHTFQILTKRADRMRAYIGDPMGAMNRRGRVLGVAWGMLGQASNRLTKYRHEKIVSRPWPLPNVWLGVSVEDQKHADERIPLLLQTPAAIRFISAEPLLGPVDIGMSAATCSCCKRWSSRWVQVHREVRPQFPINLMEGADKVVAPAGIHRAESNPHGALSVNDMGLIPSDFDALPSLDWVICGGESGGSARPFNIAWARSIVEQCADAKVACFVKQLGSLPIVDDGDLSLFSDETKFHDYDEHGGMFRVALKDRKGGDIAEFPTSLQVREFPTVTHG